MYCSLSDNLDQNPQFHRGHIHKAKPWWLWVILIIIIVIVILLVIGKMARVNQGMYMASEGVCVCMGGGGGADTAMPSCYASLLNISLLTLRC